MSYKVKVIPRHAQEGWLAQGRKTANPTYFPLPGPARKAAEWYLRKYQGDVCHIMTWKDDTFVEEIR